MSGLFQTRRGFLSGAVLAAGLAGGASAAASTLGGASTDAELLAKLLGVEQAIIYTYRYLIRSVRPSGPALFTLRKFLGHELVHAQTLTDELSRRGHRPPAPPRSASSVDGVIASLGVNGRLEQIHTQQQALQQLVFIEWGEAGVYHDAILKLANPALLRLAAQILTCEGQQSTVLIELAHNGNVTRAVPHAFMPLTADLAA